MNEENFDVQPEAESSDKSEIYQNLGVKKESDVAKLHKECAKYRLALKTSNQEKLSIQQQFDDVKKQLESVKAQSFEQIALMKLDKQGCLRSALVLKDIPQNCENLDEFIENYKKNCPFLFSNKKNKHGFSFKGGKNANYTPSQKMNNYIRSAIGR